jgi:hypothetical protein
MNIIFNDITLRYIAEGSHLHTLHRESLKSHTTHIHYKDQLLGAV